jgi:hypothetical protein
MTINVLDIYKQVLPRTNCRECGLATCLAFASAVVIEKRPISDCPYVDGDLARRFQSDLDTQQADGKGTVKDMAQDALDWARQRASSMALADMPGRIGGNLDESGSTLVLPFFTGEVHITGEGITAASGEDLNVWEKVLLYNHMAQGGRDDPRGEWIGLEQIPNSTSKVKSLKGVAEDPISQRFDARREELVERALGLGGRDVSAEQPSADLALAFSPLPKVPILLLWWDGDEADGFPSQVKVLYDVTIEGHLDIESIVFLTERLAQLLCDRP